MAEYAIFVSIVWHMLCVRLPYLFSRMAYRAGLYAIFSPRMSYEGWGGGGGRFARYIQKNDPPPTLLLVCHTTSVV